MATKIITKNSAVASAVPLPADLLQGELAVNVVDKRLYTEDNLGAIVELGTTPSTIDGAIIGGTTPAAGSFTTVNATFSTTPLVLDRSGTGGNDRDNIDLYNNGVLRGSIGTLGSTNGLTINSGATRAVTIDASGNVGINGGSITVEDSGATDAVTISANTTSTYLNTIVHGDAGLEFDNNSPSRGYAWSTNGIRRVTLDSAGKLLVGKSASLSTTIGGEMQPNGVITSTLANGTSAGSTLLVYSTDAAALRFYIRMDGTVFATSTTISAISDQRYKENVRDLDDGLSKIMALTPRKFDWKEGKGRDVKDDRGWIAQEIEQVFPDLVDEWADPSPEGEEPYKSVRPDLIPVLVKAMQEQQAMIAELQAQVAALQP